MELEPRERLIVALDVPTAGEALRLVNDLDGVVSFFKIGWQLFIGGEWTELLRDLQPKDVFVDLKVPGDIGNTIKSVVAACSQLKVKFLTLSDSVSVQTIQAAKLGRGPSGDPGLLMVPYLSSLDATDFEAMGGRPAAKLDDYIVARAALALEAGCDGLIASGKAISLLHTNFSKATIVSPGIRPAGASCDDHKRFTTPGDAIRLGANYLVVGRPVYSQTTPGLRRDAAKKIIDEIGSAMAETSQESSGRSERPDEYSAQSPIGREAE